MDMEKNSFTAAVAVQPKMEFFGAHGINLVVNLLIGHPFLVLFLLILGWFIFLRESDMDKKLRAFSTPPRLPVIGHGLDLVNVKKFLPTLTKWATMYGNRILVYFSGQNINLLVTDPDDIAKLLTSYETIEKSPIYEPLKPWLGVNNLLIGQRMEWEKRRHLLARAFHFNILETFFPVFNEQSTVLVDILRKDGQNGRPVSIYPYMTRCALDIIAETAMGQKVNAQLDKENPFVVATQKQTSYYLLRILKPWLQFHPLWLLTKEGQDDKKSIELLHGFTDKIVGQRKRKMLAERGRVKNNPSPMITDDDVYFTPRNKLAFLDLVLELQLSGKLQMTDKEVREEVDTFIFEGHDTTSVAMTWVIFLLGHHPQEQALLHEELDSVFGEDRDRPITSLDLRRLKYLGYCIKESLRIYPSVLLTSRAMSNDFQLDEKTVIPKGINVLVSPYLTHRNPIAFPDPEKFSPSRFYPENCIGRHPYVYIPFSTGARDCIGKRFAALEEKVVLAQFFRNFKVESVTSHEDVVPVPEIVLRPGCELMVRIIPR